MAKKFESPFDAHDCITRNGGGIKESIIYHPTPGLKVLSAIDYLVNHCKMSWLKINPPKQLKQKKGN